MKQQFIHLLRSKKKKDHSAQAQRSEPSPKENKPSPRKQVQGDHERKRNDRPKRLEAQKKKHQEGKETHDKRLKKNSQDPQQPPRGADPSRCISTVKGRLRQFERKGQEKKIRNRVEATSAKRPSKKRGNNQQPLMAQVGSISGNQNGEVRKGEWQQATFKSAEWDSARMGRTAKR